MKLSKVKFLDASNGQVLTKEEQKVIWGGSTNMSYCCYWESPFDHGCTGTPSTAEFMGTKHWECNTPYARKHCNC